MKTSVCHICGAQPIYDLCSTLDSPVLRIVAGERKIDRMRWQIVPANGTRVLDETLDNQRSESVFQSRLYRDLVIRQRCVVPLSGFFEWKRDGDKKRPFKIQLQDEPIMRALHSNSILHK